MKERIRINRFTEKNLKRMKERTPEKTSGGNGCLPFLLIIIVIIGLIVYSGKTIKKDFTYLTKGDANIAEFINDIKKSYSKNMTYPDFIIPLHGNITSPFGDRINPITNQPESHTGIDIDTNAGFDVLASESGKIKTVGTDERFGNYIIVEHNENFDTCYAHLEQSLKNEGDMVNKGDKIGIAGETGMATGKHLHFEIRKNENRVNPQKYISWQK